MQRITIVILTFFSFSCWAGPILDINIKVHNLVRIGHDISGIKEITGARVELISSSAGGRAREDCYQPGFGSPVPDDPTGGGFSRGVPYTISQNFPVHLEVKNENTLMKIPESLMRAEHNNRTTLKAFLNAGCKVQSNAHLLVEVTLANEVHFKSFAVIQFGINESDQTVRHIILSTGKLEYPLAIGKINGIDLMSSPFPYHIWNDMWDNMDPNIDQPRRNYIDSSH